MQSASNAAGATRRSRGITIFSVAEIILGAAGIILATKYLIGGLMIYESATMNIDVGISFMLAFILYLFASPLLIGGILMISLKPAGRFVSICCMSALLPISIPLLIYLFRSDVKKQFNG